MRPGIKLNNYAHCILYIHENAEIQWKEKIMGAGETMTKLDRGWRSRRRCKNISPLLKCTPNLNTDKIDKKRTEMKFDHLLRLGSTGLGVATEGNSEVVEVSTFSFCWHLV